MSISAVEHRRSGAREILEKLRGYLSEKKVDNQKLDYFDVRYRSDRMQFLGTRNDDLKFNHMNNQAGVAIRVLNNGRWGFAATDEVEFESLANFAEKAIAISKAAEKISGPKIELSPLSPQKISFKTPVQIDPFQVSAKEKAEMLFAAYEKSKKARAFKQFVGRLMFENVEQTILTSEGSDLENSITRSEGYYQTLVAENGDFQSRNFQEFPKAAGYEWIQELGMADDAERVAEEAYEKLKSPKGPVGKKDLVLLPSHLFLTIHESVGHPTELDRVLGWEANFAGTSFAKPEMLGEFQYGSSLVNFQADNNMPGGLASQGFDDDGVPAQTWDVIKEGRLINFCSTRETAPIIGQNHSYGCNRADSFKSQPINRIPNLSLLPGAEGTSLDDLIAGVEDGILIDGRGSFSIDQNRVNFQFGGDRFLEIKNGKVGGALRDVTYQSQSVPFWRSCDGIADQNHWKIYGATNCGKGEPGQRACMTHGSSPARFRQIDVGGALNG